MVVIFNDGSGDFFCIDSEASRPDGEAPVVRFQPGIPVPTQRPEVIASDFGSSSWTWLEGRYCARHGPKAGNSHR
jgi:hypothetical protein